MGYVTGFFCFGNLVGNFFRSISRSSIRPSQLWSTRPLQLTEFFRRCHLWSIQSQMLSVKVDRNPILSICDSVNMGPTIFCRVCSKQFLCFKKILMSGFELQASGIRSDHSANWATSTSFVVNLFPLFFFIIIKKGQSRPLFQFIFVFSTCYRTSPNLNW